VIEISADMGEGAPDEPQIWPLIDAANVACGGHYGDEQTMRAAVADALNHSVVIGAHPSYPDRANFGRKSMQLDPASLRETLVEQIRALAALTPLRHVKAHGALYNHAHRDAALAAILLDALTTVGASLAIVCPARSEMSTAAAARGIRVIREAFADRRYERDGSLTPRSVERSTLDVNEAAAQARLLAREGVVIARDGTRIALPFDTLCVHSDMPQAVARLRAIRAVC
jgi:UPF0271 protein